MQNLERESIKIISKKVYQNNQKNAAARGSEVSAIIRDYIHTEKQILFNTYENYLLLKLLQK